MGQTTSIGSILASDYKPTGLKWIAILITNTLIFYLDSGKFPSSILLDPVLF